MDESNESFEERIRLITGAPPKKKPKLATTTQEALEQLEANGIPVPLSVKMERAGYDSKNLPLAVDAVRPVLVDRQETYTNRPRMVEAFSSRLAGKDVFNVAGDTKMELSYTVFPIPNKVFTMPGDFPPGLVLAPGGITLQYEYADGRPKDTPITGWPTISLSIQDNGRGLFSPFPGLLEHEIIYGPEPPAEIKLSFDDDVALVTVKVIGFIY